MGIVSLAMGMSSAMIYGLLPVFLVTTLGASTLLVGAIEGIAEATNSFMKIFSGALSDWLRRRKPLVVLGYGLSTCVKVLFPLADAPVTVLLARSLDRVGKGMRDAPRDALLADVTPSTIRGSGYGLLRAFYTMGAVAGPLAAMGLMATSGDDFRLVFWMALIPAAISVVVLWVWVRDSQNGAAESPRRIRFRRSDLAALPGSFWWAVSIAAILALARFSPAFLMLKAQNVGIAISLVPLAWMLMHAVYGITAYPFGVLSDRSNPRLQLTGGIFLLVAADLTLALGDTVWAMAAGVVFWGFHLGVMQGMLAALIANSAPEHLRGTAFGLCDLAVGAATLLASSGAGALWLIGGPTATFSAGAILAGLGMLLLFVGRGCDRFNLSQG
jgi:MFS family permease